eukprot:9482180-Ditylum_brightwellii.AAC.1
MEPDGYCWSCGYCVPKNHNSLNCDKKKSGHQFGATHANIMGGKLFQGEFSLITNNKDCQVFLECEFRRQETFRSMLRTFVTENIYEHMLGYYQTICDLKLGSKVFFTHHQIWKAIVQGIFTISSYNEIKIFMEKTVFGKN